MVSNLHFYQKVVIANGLNGFNIRYFKGSKLQVFVESDHQSLIIPRECALGWYRSQPPPTSLRLSCSSPQPTHV